MTARPELRLDGFAAGHAGIPAVSGVSFALGEGGRIGVIGRNGAGKTSLVSAIMGIAQTLRGAITWDGVDIGSASTFRRARLGLGYVPQGREIFPSLSVRENLLCALKGQPAESALALAYRLFPRLKERERNGGTQLSGGEQQMLSIARALVGRPRILLMDEPLEGLAPQLRAEVMAAIHRLTAETGVGCLLVEQHVDVVLEFASDVLILENGRVAFWGPSEELRRRPEIIARTIGLERRATAG